MAFLPLILPYSMIFFFLHQVAFRFDLIWGGWVHLQVFKRGPGSS